MVQSTTVSGETRLLSDSDVRDNYTRLANHNGGWAVMGCHSPKEIGSVHEAFGFRFSVIAESNAEFADPRPYYYRIMVDYPHAA